MAGLRRRSLGYAGVLIVSFLLLGCLDRLPPVQPATQPLDASSERAQRDSVIAAIEAMDRSAIDSAFHRLTAFSYERVTDVRQLDAAGDVVASRHVVERFSGPREDRRRVLVSADSSGRFESGLFGSFSETAVSEEEHDEPGRLILSDDPPFLTGRGREAYRFRILADSTSAGRTFARLLVDLRPEERDAQNLRRVRLSIDRESNLLVAADVVISQHAMLYQERSYLTLRLDRSATGAWLPARMTVDTHVGSTVFDPLRYRVETTYRDVPS